MDWIPLTLCVVKMVMNARFEVSPALMLRIVVFRDVMLYNGVI
jgi:hypothetical protein